MQKEKKKEKKKEAQGGSKRASSPVTGEKGTLQAWGRVAP
jgi:hypothetical protein